MFMDARPRRLAEPILNKLAATNPALALRVLE
jgi:hypothetical protein